MTSAATDRASAPSVLLLYARTPVEEKVLRGWAADRRQAGEVPVHAGRGELLDQITRDDGDPEVVPVRVAWLPRERDGHRRARLRDVVALNDPRRPSAGAQERIARQEPERYRVVVGEPAKVSELRRRFEAEGGERFDAFV